MTFIVGNPERPECQTCGLWQKAKNPFIPPVVEKPGKPVDLALTGEAPGKNEDAEKQYFVGKCGKLLDKIIDESPFRNANVGFFNCCQCWPGPGEGGKGDAKPTTDQMRACRPLLLANLAAAAPTAVVALGTWGVRALTDDGTATIGGKRPTRVRTLTIKDSTWQPEVCTATYHPAATYQFQPQTPKCILEDLTWVSHQVNKTPAHMPEYTILTKPEEFLFVTKDCPTVIDLEYDGTEGGTDLYSVAIQNHNGAYGALLQHPENQDYDHVAWVAVFQKWIDTVPVVIGHNLPSDLLALARAGVRLPEMVKIQDTLAAARVKWHNDPDRSLETLAAAKLNFPDYAAAITPFKREHGGKFGYYAPGKVLLDYNVGDVWATNVLAGIIPGLPPFLWAHMMEAEYNLVLTTWDGQYVDGQAGIDVFLTLDRRILRWRAKLEQITNIPGYNYRDAQHKLWPFETLGWEPMKTGPNGPSLDEEILFIKKRQGRLKSKRFARALLKLKKAENAQNRLKSDILGRVDSDGLIHAQFNTAGARTLRLSSKQPNFQNLSKELRKPFVSRWGKETV